MSSPATTGERASPKRLEIPQALRALVRARESGLVVVAALVGAVSGAIVAAMGHAVTAMHHKLFGVALDQRLSAQSAHRSARSRCWCRRIGGALLGLRLWILVRVRPGREIDPIEANALHGGRMSFRGSLIVAFKPCGRAASAHRSGLKPASRNSRAASLHGSDGRSACAGATCACWSAAARRPRLPARSARHWRARSMPSSW